MIVSKDNQPLKLLRKLHDCCWQRQGLQVAE